MVFSILPHIVEHQLRLAQSTKALGCEDVGVGRVMSPVVQLSFDLSVYMGTGYIIGDGSKRGVRVVMRRVWAGRSRATAIEGRMASTM